jgi:hypothetical protein
LAREERPSDGAYYEQRIQELSQGDVFRDVPLAYPLPAVEIVLDPEADLGARQFLSGPFELGHAILLSPTCSMRAQKTGGYAHPVRILAVVRPLSELIEQGIFTSDRLGLLRKYDALINYMYLPPVEHLPESVALLYMSVTLHHDMIAGNRIIQLTRDGAQQLQRKLVWFNSGLLWPRGEFAPPMD